MAQQKQITLRNVKGSALTYEEMDKNLSSFFHSASLSGTNLLLHYTGSTVLGPDYIPSSISVPLNPLLATITQLQVAGNNEGDIQYRIDDSTLGANTSFKWDTNNYRLGVGVPSPEATIHVIGQTEPTTVRISATTANKQANIDFTSPIGLLGSFGKTRTNSSNIFIDLPNISGGGNLITTVGGTNITRTNSTGLGIFTGTSNPNKALTVVGVIGVGTDIGENQGQIGNIITPQFPLGKVAQIYLPDNSNRTGLLIESPFKSTGAQTGGHVVVGINKTGTTANTSFSVIAGANGIYNTPIITAKADNKVGINKPNPSEALDIIGNTTMTGSINVTGTATIVTVADSQGANPKVLTVNGSGLVQYANNLMPKGGIIMWGGTIPNIPTGWKLCDGNSGTPVNGVTIPDLRERFIVGAGGNNADIIDYNYNEFKVSGTYNFNTGNTIVAKTFNNAIFTKVSDSAAVDNNLYQFPYLTTVGGNPNVSKQHAVYYLNGGTPTTSFFIVYDTDINRYVIYNGTLPTTTNTSLANASSYPYYNLPIGAQAVLKQVGNNVTYRPNWIGLLWQQNTTGYNVGDTGGFNNVELEISEMPSHTHGMPQGSVQGGIQGTYVYTSGDDGTGGLLPYAYPPTDFTGNDFPHENRPPYYALAFIIYTGVQ